MYPQSELLFPHHSVGALTGLRDEEWDTLVKRIATLPETHVDSLAFLLLVIRTCDCLKCDMGSYKASLGCTVCAQRAVSGDRDLDGRLAQQFEAARGEIIAYLERREQEERAA
jgi:hypothetical protein